MAGYAFGHEFHLRGQACGTDSGAARSEGWFAALGVKGRRAFRAAYTGYMLDAFDLIVLTLSLSAIGATFSVGTGATGALSTVALSASGDRRHPRRRAGRPHWPRAHADAQRRRLLGFHVPVGLATSYEMLMVFRVFQGIGFGAGVGRRRRAGRRARAARGAREGAWDHPERLGRGLGARRDRLPDRVRGVRRAVPRGACSCASASCPRC